MPSLDAVWEQAAVVAVLGLWLWSGHKGWWFWSPGVRLIVTQITRERDDWRTLAVTLLRKQGVELPPGFERASVGVPRVKDSVVGTRRHSARRTA